ncbi:MAG: tyrosine-type recombinase/integrase [Planctomycetota bacterium]
MSIHTLRKSCGQNWANHLPINVVKELMGHSSISTIQKFYNQVDDDHRAKTAAVVDLLVSGSDTERNKVGKTDARS